MKTNFICVQSASIPETNDNKQQKISDSTEQALIIPVVMQWVAVEDAMPPVELDVLVWDEFNIYITNRLDSNYIVWDESTQILDNVTHWMYLPEPPCA